MNENLTRCDACGDTKNCHDVGDFHICTDCHVDFVLSTAIADATSAANKRIAELEISHKEIARDQLAIAQALTDVGIEHSGYKKQAERVTMLIERLRTSQQRVLEYARQRNDARRRVYELEAQLAAYQISENRRLDAIPEASGQDYVEGYKP
jgi:DNA repair exonuclease SbcCD ATPase subunit